MKVGVLEGVNVAVGVRDGVNVGVIVGVDVIVGLGVYEGSRQSGAESILPKGVIVSPYSS